MNSKTIYEQLLMAKRCFDSNDNKGAEQILFQVIELEPQNVDALLGIARVKTMSKDWNSAIKYQRLALKYEPSEIHILSYLCQLLLVTKDFKGLLKALLDFKGVVPVNLLKALLIRLYDHYEVERCKELLIQWQVKTSHEYNQLITSLPQNSDFELLRITYLAATERFPNESNFWQKLANVEARLSNYDAALTAFDKATSGKDITASLGLAYADLCILAHKLDEAQKWLGLIFDRLSNDNHLLNWTEAQIRIHHFNGNTKGAIKHATFLLTKTTVNGYVWRTLIETAENEKLANMLEDLTSSLKEVSDPFHSKMMSYALAKGYDRLKNYGLAYDCYEIANRAQNIHLKKIGHSFSDVSERKYFEFLKNINVSPVTLHSKTDEYAPIFLVGLPRSGSTLLEKVLAQHPRVIPMGECAVWGNLINNKLIQQISNKQPPELNGAEISHFRHSYINAIGNKNIISIDKMPHNFRFAPFIIAAFPNAKIIQLRRKKEAVCWSVFTQPFSDIHNYSTTLPDIAAFYQQSYELMDYWGKSYPKNIVDIRYEDIVEKTHKTLSDLFEWCGLNWDPKFLDFYLSNKPSFTFSENQVREPINSKGLEKWLNYKPYFPSNFS
ncbi:tetratricopeptide repeat-containing sulfotransferase family protein [Paraglaciecola sp. 2405UD69-4]|uniref:tetratricopeptide repeat-containing sulfotransferase family protein n=1 Tax=Paraglaciecola sp. 2405UD69-4 TaxID=3391836 RepID=UPI0039C8EC2D